MPTATAEFAPVSSAATAFAGVAAASSFDYEAEILKAWETFPEIKDRVYFVDIPANEGLYPGSRLLQHGLNELLRRDEGIQSLVARYSNERKSSCCIPLKDDKSCILLYTAENPASMWNRVMPHLHSVTFTFDHELAHAVIADANGAVDRHLGECIADAYATIRHFQRFGADSTSADSLVLMRAARFVFADKDNDRGKIHFTSPVIEQLLARRHDVDWEKMTPQETAGLARRFGLMYAPHPILLERMDERFRECHTGPDSVSQGNTSGLTRLADILEKQTFPAFLKWGARALEFFAAEADALPGMKEARLRIRHKAQLLENTDDILSGLGDAQRQVLRSRHKQVIANQP